MLPKCIVLLYSAHCCDLIQEFIRQDNLDLELFILLTGFEEDPQPYPTLTQAEHKLLKWCQLYHTRITIFPLPISKLCFLSYIDHNKSCNLKTIISNIDLESTARVIGTLWLKTNKIGLYAYIKHSKKKLNLQPESPLIVRLLGEKSSGIMVYDLEGPLTKICQTFDQYKCVYLLDLNSQFSLEQRISFANNSCLANKTIFWFKDLDSDHANAQVINLNLQKLTPQAYSLGQGWFSLVKAKKDFDNFILSADHVCSDLLSALNLAIKLATKLTPKARSYYLKIDPAISDNAKLQSKLITLKNYFQVLSPDYDYSSHDATTTLIAGAQPRDPKAVYVSYLSAVLIMFDLNLESLLSYNFEESAMALPSKSCLMLGNKAWHMMSWPSHELIGLDEALKQPRPAICEYYKSSAKVAFKYKNLAKNLVAYVPRHYNQKMLGNLAKKLNRSVKDLVLITTQLPDNLFLLARAKAVIYERCSEQAYENAVIAGALLLQFTVTALPCDSSELAYCTVDYGAVKLNGKVTVRLICKDKTSIIITTRVTYKTQLDYMLHSQSSYDLLSKLLPDLSKRKL